MFQHIEKLYTRNKKLLNALVFLPVLFVIFLSIEKKQRYLAENEEDHFYRYIGTNFYTTCAQVQVTEILKDKKINFDDITIEEVKKNIYLPSYFTKDAIESKSRGPKYAYAPHTIPIVKFLCENTSPYKNFLYKFYLPSLLIASLLLVLLLWKKMEPLSIILTLGFFSGGFGGLDANLFLGNFESLTALILFTALYIMNWGMYRAKTQNQLYYLILGSFVLGYYMAFKFVMIYLIVALIFLPLIFKEKILCIFTCLFSYFFFPLLSYLFQKDLFIEIISFYTAYFTGKQAPHTGLGNSLMSLRKEKLVEICRFDLANNTIYCLIHFYLNKIWPSFKANLAPWMPLSLLAFVSLSAYSTFRIFIKYSRIFESKKFQLVEFINFKKLRERIVQINDYLVKNREIGLYITLLAFFVLYIVLPRIQYHYVFSLVVISTFLFMQLKLSYQLPVFFFCILIPYFFDYTISQEKVSDLISCYTHIVSALFAFSFFMMGLKELFFLDKKRIKT